MVNGGKLTTGTCEFVGPAFDGLPSGIQHGLRDNYGCDCTVNLSHFLTLKTFKWRISVQENTWKIKKTHSPSPE